MIKSKILQENEIRIHFGAACDSFIVQAKRQGLRYEKETMKLFQSYHKAMLILRFAGLLGDASYSKMQATLFKRILAHLQRQNKPH